MNLKLIVISSEIIENGNYFILLQVIIKFNSLMFMHSCHQHNTKNEKSFRIAKIFIFMN
jgi:hypothetical protein